MMSGVHYLNLPLGRHMKFHVTKKLKCETKLPRRKAVKLVELFAEVLLADQAVSSVFTANR